MMTENLMMEGVRRGGDRQVLHERVRIHSQAAADAMKSGAATNDLFDRIAADSLFGIDRAAIDAAGAAGELHRPLEAADGALPDRRRRSDPRSRAKQIRAEAGEVRV